MELTSEQRALRDAVRDAVGRHPSGPDPVSDLGLWRALGDIGVPGLAIPERFGGAGAGPVEISVVAEELGRALAKTPLIGSAVLATQAILGSGDIGACERLLPGIADGSAIAALAWTGLAGGWDPAEVACHAEPRPSGGWSVTGAAHYVLDGEDASVLIAAATMPEGTGLFEIELDQPGVELLATPAMDQTRRMALVRLAAAAERPLGPDPDTSGTAAGSIAASAAAARMAPAALSNARDLACIARSAEQAGAAARALELTVEYTGSRIQFGRPIASFQAIQHRLADARVLVESARSLAFRAAAVAAAEQAAAGLGGGGWAAGRGGGGWAAARGGAPELPMLAAAAKAYCSEALLHVAGEMIQLHGAIGITWEHDAQRYFKRAHGAAQLFGQPSAHVARIAASLIDR